MIYTKQDAIRFGPFPGRILAGSALARLLFREKCLYLYRLPTRRSVYRILFIELQKWKNCNRTGLTGRVRADTKGTDSACPFEVLPLPVVRKPGSVPFVMLAGPVLSDRCIARALTGIGYRAKMGKSVGPVFLFFPCKKTAGTLARRLGFGSRTVSEAAFAVGAGARRVPSCRCLPGSARHPTRKPPGRLR